MFQHVVFLKDVSLFPQSSFECMGDLFILVSGWGLQPLKMLLRVFIILSLFVFDHVRIFTC